MGGALVDEYRLTYGFWEAKDTADDLAKEVKKKLAAGYPQNNIIFQAPDRAILMQNGRVVLDEDISEADAIVQFLKRFLEYIPPEFEEWTDAVEHFRDRVPELGEALKELIEKEQKSSPRFRDAFDTFFELCRQSINPNLSKEAVEEMIIQHLLTERIFRTVFNNPDFTRRNVIAVEIEKVIDVLTSQSLSRDHFSRASIRFTTRLNRRRKPSKTLRRSKSSLTRFMKSFSRAFRLKSQTRMGLFTRPFQS